MDPDPVKQLQVTSLAQEKRLRRGRHFRTASQFTRWPRRKVRSWLVSGAACFAGFKVFTGFTGIARNAEIVIRTTSSVCNPSAFANPGDKSATRPVEIFGPQSTGRASAARPFARFSTRASAHLKNSLGVSL